VNKPRNAKPQKQAADGLDPGTQATLKEFESLVEALAKPSYVLRLFVTGASPRSTAAIASVRSICEQYLPGRYELEVVDIYQQPEETRKAQVIAAPTLIKMLPFPTQRFVGHMSNSERILVALNLKT
jgi:circadian clock protein KaiB